MISYDNGNESSQLKVCFNICLHVISSMFEVCLKYEKNTRDPILVKSQRVNEINESTI